MHGSRYLHTSLGSFIIASLVGGCVIPKLVGDGLDAEGNESSSGNVGSGSVPTATSTTSATDDGSSSASVGASESTGSPPQSDSSDTGAIFLVTNDGGISDPCGIWPGDWDCPKGEKCMPWADDDGNAWNATRCSPVVDEPDALGDPCTVENDATSGFDSCGLGAMCWDVDPETLEGTCVGMCAGTLSRPICEEEGTACAQLTQAILILCLPTCDPVLQDCESGHSCQPVDDEFFCVPAIPGGMGGVGESCESIAVCDPGLACVQPELVPDCASNACCTAYCDTEDPMPSCLPGQVCTPWYEPGMAPPGAETLGACAQPM